MVGALGGVSLISMLALYMIQHSFLIHLGVPNTMKNLATGYAQCDRVVLICGIGNMKHLTLEGYKDKTVIL
jgi:hypothetical protein